MGVVRETFVLVGIVLDMLAAALAGATLMLADHRIDPPSQTILRPPSLLSVEDHAARGDLWGIESDADLDYVLDQRALDYLPMESQARVIGERIYWCGTPAVALSASSGRAITVPERHLLLRAIRLQQHYAPAEVVSGPHITEAACRTQRCSGRLNLDLQETRE